MKGLILAIETASPVCSVAICNHQGLIKHKEAVGIGVHSEKTLQFIESILNEFQATIQDLGTVLVNGGPGSYTGLRIGSSVAKGLLFAHHAELVSVSTLVATAYGIFKKNKNVRTVHSVLNARRTHLYHHQFEFKNDCMVEIMPQAIRSLEEIESLITSGDMVAGDGVQRLKGDNKGITIFDAHNAINAVNLIELYLSQMSDKFCHIADPATFEPDY